MSGDTVECFNCGHANPSWAQVCRSCGTPIRPGGPVGSGPRGIVPTDQASLIAIGGTVGAIALAIVFGLVVSGMIPAVPAETPSPTPSISVEPSPSPTAIPSLEETAEPSPSIAPLIGTITFGTGINPDTREVTNPTESFSGNVGFAHSISLTEPFGVTVIYEEVVRVTDDGGFDVVQERVGSDLPVKADRTVAGFKSGIDAARLAQGWGTGSFILRVYRENAGVVELLAEGSFSLS